MQSPSTTRQEIGMNTPNTQTIDILGKKLGEAALTLLVRLYPDVRQASDAQLEAACAAMRAKSRAVIDELIDDAKDAPGVAHIAFQTAALTLAHEGIQALKAGRKKICEARQKKLGFQVEQRLNAITINDATRSRT
jgi:hypothetical protein